MALKLIFDKLLEGVCFGEIREHRMGGTYFWEVLGIHNKYIAWRHYGSSANKITLGSLKWIIEVIFQMTPEEFLFKYTTNNEWKHIDSCYK